MNLVPHEVTPAPPPSTLMVRRSGIGMRWSFGRDLGTIGLVLGAPARQGRGIGRALKTRLIADSAPRALMLNATAEGRGLYQNWASSLAGWFASIKHIWPQA
jgi:hypothetical protein